jgi:hypothetical protein
MESVWPGYEGKSNRTKLLKVVGPLILNMWDGHLAQREVLVDLLSFPGLSGDIDRGYVENAMTGLGAVGALASSVNFEQGRGFLCGFGPLFDEEDLSRAKAEALDLSQPLDVHRWSDNPEVNAFVGAIYEQHFSGGNALIRKKHLKVLLLDLYVRWCIDPALKTAIQRDANAYRAGSRYNALHISKLTAEVVDVLVEAGLLFQAIGYSDRVSKRGRVTRIWPTPSLIKAFEEARFGPMDIGVYADRETVILRDEAGNDIEYDDDDNTNRMRTTIQSYNSLLRRTFIDIPELDERFIRITDGGMDSRLYVTQNDKFVRRIFNRGSFEDGGRLYGGWWQRCPKEWRAQIFINDQPVTELDYSGLHPVLLYASEGIDYWREIGGDPYAIRIPGMEAFNDQRLRKLAKRLFLIAINARDDKAACSAFRADAEASSPEKRMSNGLLLSLLDALREKHPKIAHLIATDQGIKLQNLDAHIAERIIERFTGKRVPVLAIHDSFIVPLAYGNVLRHEMVRAFVEITGAFKVRLTEETENPLRMLPYTFAQPSHLKLGRDLEPLATSDVVNRRLHKRLNPPRSVRYQRELVAFKNWLGQPLAKPPLRIVGLWLNRSPSSHGTYDGRRPTRKAGFTEYNTSALALGRSASSRRKS